MTKKMKKQRDLKRSIKSLAAAVFVMEKQRGDNKDVKNAVHT